MTSGSKYFSAEAIVLSSQAQGEFDMSVSLATGEFGLLKARMPGVRRSRSRLKPLKEPGVFAEASFYGKPGQPQPLTLRTGRVVESFCRSRASFDKFQIFLETLRFSENFLVPFDHCSQEKFFLLTRTLEFLDTQDFTLTQLRNLGLTQILSYKLKILDLSGWRFSASDLAKSRLNVKELQLCENLEMDLPITAAHGMEKKLEMFIDIYTENLAGYAL